MAKRDDLVFACIPELVDLERHGFPVFDEVSQHLPRTIVAAVGLALELRAQWIELGVRIQVGDHGVDVAFVERKRQAPDRLLMLGGHASSGYPEAP